MIAAIYSRLHNLSMDQLRKNLRFLMESAGHNPNSLAEASGASQPNIFRILEGESGEPRRKTIEPLANYFGVIVEDLKYKDLTQPHQVQQPVARYENSEMATVRISNASASMGLGIPTIDNEQSITSMQLTRSWINGHIKKITSVDDLAILTAYGDSMTPTFNDGDLLLVDRGIHHIDVDGVFVLQRRDELFVKRLQRRYKDGAIIIKSDNPLFGEEIVENGEREHLEVLGRVLWAWAGKKL